MGVKPARRSNRANALLTFGLSSTTRTSHGVDGGLGGLDGPSPPAAGGTELLTTARLPRSPEKSRERIRRLPRAGAVARRSANANVVSAQGRNNSGISEPVRPRREVKR